MHNVFKLQASTALPGFLQEHQLAPVDATGAGGSDIAVKCSQRFDIYGIFKPQCHLVLEFLLTTMSIQLLPRGQG